MAKTSVSVAFPNAAELQKKLQSVPAKVAGAAVRTGVFKAAQWLGEQMKMYLTASPAIRTGKLRDSIKARRSKNNSEMTSSKVGPRQPHAHLIELGHRSKNPAVYVPAEPFIAPAFLSGQPEMQKIISEHITQALDSALKGK